MFNQHFLNTYLNEAPIALATERVQECILLSECAFEAPILDVGCGDGIFAKVLFNSIIDVGIDPNPIELKRANRTLKYNELIQCYGNSIPKPDGYFKTIFSNSVMEHIPDITSVLNEMYRLLDNDGRIYLTVPTDLFDKYTITSQILRKLGMHKLTERYSRLFNKFWCHYHCYDAEQWRLIFNRAGFCVTHQQEYGKKSLCIFNSIMNAFALPSLFARKIRHEWFWLKFWRKLYVNILYRFIMIDFNNIKTHQGKGGLIFFELRKCK